MTGREARRCEARNYEQQANGWQCHPSLDFTSSICLHQLSETYRDKASVCRRQWGKKGDSMYLIETQPTQFHELCLLSPSVGNPKLLSTLSLWVIPNYWRSHKERRHKPLSWCCSSAGKQQRVQSCRTRSSRQKGQGPGSQWKRWALEISENPAGPEDPKCLGDFLPSLHCQGYRLVWANKHQKKLHEDVEVYTLEAQGLAEVSWQTHSSWELPGNAERNGTGSLFSVK